MRRTICGAAILWAAATAALAAAPPYRILDRLAGPDGGWDYVRADPTHDRILLAHGKSVTRFDLATGKVTNGLAPGARLHDALPVNGGAELLVTDGGADQAVFADAETGAAVATIATGKGPDAAGLDPRTGLVLVMDHNGGEIILIDPRTHAKTGEIAVGGDLEAVAFDGAGRAYVNVEDKNQTVVLDLAARKVVARYPLAGCDGPTGIAADVEDKVLLVACDGTMDIVDMATGKVRQTLATGKGADGVAWDAERRLAFVPAGQDGKLSVVAMANGKGTIIQTLPTQRGARTIALDPKSHRLYLPAARYGPPATPGGRPAMTPGSFRLLVVGR
jgi:DNA-binding beta-propeller fold protein YncE